MRFSTAVRNITRRRLERLGSADILIGVPCFNNETTIREVVSTIEAGLLKYFPEHRSVVVVADGGSVDDSREEAEELERSAWIERITTIYRGVPGKGSAVRAIFESAHILDAKVCALFDSDLRSMTPEWVKCMVDPILKNEYDFITPYYTRYKYDGTITNNIVYNLTRALYGYQVRQPIGGDFSFSAQLVKKYIDQQVWETNVGRFGVDIWLTTMAMVDKVRIAQANLGVKIHDVKDPAEALGPMFRQVVSTLLTLMEDNEATWKKVKGSKPVPIIGPSLSVEPQSFSINVDKLIADYQMGYDHFGEIWKKIIQPESFKVIENLKTGSKEHFDFPVEVWVKVLYDLAVTYHHWKTDRQLLVNLMTPLYFARIASFVLATWDKNNGEAEAVVENQAMLFEQMKDYLIERWDSADIPGAV